MQDDLIKCINCLYFDSNNFCRRFPPQSINSGRHTDKNTGFVTTFASAMFPIIKKPELDWCGEFVSCSENNN